MFNQSLNLAFVIVQSNLNGIDKLLIEFFVGIVDFFGFFIKQTL